MPVPGPGRRATRSLPLRLGTEFEVLCRKLQEAPVLIERMEDRSTVLERSLECLLDRFEDELGFEGSCSDRREGPDQEPFGLERFRALPAESAGASARRTVDTVLTVATEHGGGSPVGDDMTVVVVRRL